MFTFFAHVYPNKEHTFHFMHRKITSNPKVTEMDDVKLFRKRK